METLVCDLLHVQAQNAKTQNDDYDDSDKGSQSDSDSSQGSDDEIEGVDIPDPAQSAPVPATGSVPTAGPPGGGKAVQEAPLSVELSLGQGYHNPVDIGIYNIQFKR